MLNILFVLSTSLSLIAPATDMITPDVHRLIAAEQFERADGVAQAQLARATGSDEAAQRRRLAALNLLIDSAIAQHRLTSEACGRWIEEVIALHQQLSLDRTRLHAKVLAVASVRARRSTATPGAIQNANELARQSADLVEHANGDLAAYDEAFIYQAIAAMEIDGGHMSQGVAAFAHAKKILTPAHTDYEEFIRAQVLTALGTFELQIGDRTQALSDVRAGVDLARKAGGGNSRQYAAALAELGKLQFFSADLVAARQTLQQALAILRRYPGEAFTTNIAANFLANATMELGDLDAARMLYREAVATSKDDAAIYLASRLNGLALLEKMAGNLATSRDLLQQALALDEQRYDRSYYGLVPMLNNLGILSLKQDDLPAAQSSFQRALDIASARSGGVIYDVLSAREGLASVALARAQPQEADDLLTKSIDELERGYGDGHPDLIFLGCEQALAKARLGQRNAAFALASKSETLRVDLLRRTAPALGENEMVNLKARLNDCGGLVAALASISRDDEQIKQAWQLLAASRGLAAHLSSARLAVARNATDASKRQAWSAWDSAARSYAELLLKSRVAGDALGKARSALQEAESKLDVPKDAASEIADIVLPELLQGLPETSSLVAYFVTDQFDVGADARSDPQVHRLVKSPHSLYAFIRRRDAIKIVSLGDTATIDFKIEYWNRLLRDPASDPTQLTAAGRAVREAVWDPLAIGQEPGSVFVVPDGSLYRVNFDALADGDGYLVEHGWRVHLLDSERDLAAAPAAPPRQSLLLVGAPDFGHLAANADTRGEVCSDGFAPLPATKREIAGVATLWNAASANPPTILTGIAASKDALRQAATRSEIIHIATHAAEFDRKCNTNAARGMGIGAPSAPPAALKPAALALAGANAFLDRGDTSGILTSEEVVTMSLDNTQWIVLSACDTGLGPVVYGEGVFGLRRAFRLAGARTVIMSLWEVDDTATAEWMQALYRARLSQHSSVPESIAQAQLSVLAARRARGESVHPYFWAAFVASGDWR